MKNYKEALRYMLETGFEVEGKTKGGSRITLRLNSDLRVEYFYPRYGNNVRWTLREKDFDVLFDSEFFIPKACKDSITGLGFGQMLQEAKKNRNRRYSRITSWDSYKKVSIWWDGTNYIRETPASRGKLQEKQIYRELERDSEGFKWQGEKRIAMVMWDPKVETLFLSLQNGKRFEIAQYSKSGDIIRYYPERNSIVSKVLGLKDGVLPVKQFVEFVTDVETELEY